jgi:hypothetical protein
MKFFVQVHFTLFLLLYYYYPIKTMTFSSSKNYSWTDRWMARVITRQCPWSVRFWAAVLHFDHWLPQLLAAVSTLSTSYKYGLQCRNPGHPVIVLLHHSSWDFYTRWIWCDLPVGFICSDGLIYYCSCAHVLKCPTHTIWCIGCISCLHLTCSFYNLMKQKSHGVHFQNK